MTEKAVAVDKVRQKLSGSPAKSAEREGRKVSRTRQGQSSPDRKESRSSSPRKKESLDVRRRRRRSRSRSKSPQKSVSSLDTGRRSSGSSARVVEVHQTANLEAEHHQDQEEEIDDETGGSSVSLDV